MKKQDARKLSPDAQEDLRKRVFQALQQGMKISMAARTFGISRASIHNWLNRVQEEGSQALKSKPRGRPKRSRLKGWQAATTVKLITDRCPDQLKMPFALWTREAVQHLLDERFDVQVSVWTVGRYLKQWDLTPQKPLRRAYEQNPTEVKRWLEREYPAIRRRAKQEKAEIHWGDQMGLRSDHQTGTSYGRKGETPVIPGTGKRFSCNMISTVTNRGHLSFMVFKERFTAPVMIRFLKRLIRHCRRKVFLIVDRHPVHLSAKVGHWLTAHRNRIEMFLLPGYSPELNPDEYLNQDVKSNALGRERPGNQMEMIYMIRSYLYQTQRRPDIVCNYFKAEDVAYAAA